MEILHHFLYFHHSTFHLLQGKLPFARSALIQCLCLLLFLTPGDLTLTIRTYNIFELGVYHSFHLTELAKTLEKVVFPEKVSPLIRQGQGVGIAYGNLLFRLNLSIGNHSEKPPVKILSAVGLAIMIHVVCLPIYSNCHPVSLT